MSGREASRAVRVGYALTNFLLIVSVGFAAFLLVDGAVGVARGGERLVSGRSLDVHVQVPPERIRLPDGLRHDGWLPAVAQSTIPAPKKSCSGRRSNSPRRRSSSACCGFCEVWRARCGRETRSARPTCSGCAASARCSPSVGCWSRSSTRASGRALGHAAAGPLRGHRNRGLQSSRGHAARRAGGVHPGRSLRAGAADARGSRGNGLSVAG